MQDPAYHNARDHRGFDRRVFLDGQEVKDVTECHTRQGWVTRVKRNESGSFHTDDGVNVATETLRGHVRVARFE